jgi:uncharacterized protein with HEPN domain
MKIKKETLMEKIRILWETFGVDLEKVWLILTQEIPLLKIQVEKILQKKR